MPPFFLWYEINSSNKLEFSELRTSVKTCVFNLLDWSITPSQSKNTDLYLFKFNKKIFI